ncbi:deoxyguanosinetriphosphate triphosphohydrolase family protein [Nocardioides solisilvae]|uniref:deoxyguanosinetriphosphate triphosphohydrolase family protein n=1 Tax=Nocardioides solisilvae TaxID=1542435 RepID=UPI000D743996|nr:dNTP triphosphohydrolase [Nocardioides solisilvae]
MSEPETNVTDDDHQLPDAATRTSEEPGPTGDGRTPSEHDCDRILYSDELRRLGGVTQVVAVGEMPLFHTRLTHTLKVQQLSRRMAEHLKRDPSNKSVIKSLGGLDVGAAESAGLAHDLGHPPFGHVGETALNERCYKAGLDGFEGNAQTFRILATLSRRGENTPFGLDLSDATLRAVIKYPWLRGEAGDASLKKWNAYGTEREAFLRARGGLPDGARSAEAAIMDWADDITYAIHDLEDFIRAGRVPMVALATVELEREAFTTRAVSRLRKKYKDTDWDTAVKRFGDVLTLEFAQFNIHNGTADDLARLRSVCSRLINSYVSAIRLVEGPEPIEIPPLVRAEVELFKQLTWHYVIHDPALATLQEGQAELLRCLFDRLTKWLDDAIAAKEEFRLPKRLYDLWMVTETEPGRSEFGVNEHVRRARAVADYIASLTETQAIDLYERLTGTGAHSVLDPWLAY